MLVNWFKTKPAEEHMATSPAFNPSVVSRAPAFSDASKKVASDTGFGAPSIKNTSSVNDSSPPAAKLHVVSSQASVSALPSVENQTKNALVESMAEFKALVPFHADMLGVTWISRRGLCSNSQMTEQVGAFRQKDGSAIVVMSDRAQSAYLPGFIEALKSDSVVVKATHLLASRLLAELYQEASDRKRNAMASDSDELNETTAMRMFTELIKKGASVNASDLDIICKGDTADFMFRVDGFRKIDEQYPQRLGETLIQNVYSSRAVKDDTRSNQNYLPKQRQNLLLFVTLDDGSKQYLRMQTLPGLSGPTCNWRLLPRKGKKQQFVSLEQLGYAPDQERKLMSALTGRNGMVLFLGQTGMGKSTTMDLCFTLHPRKESIKIIEVADPPEIENPFVIKHAVRGGGDSSGEADVKMWTGALGAALRSDPDIIAIGELRYAETALMAQQAMLSGHLTVASFHASSPFQAIERLLEMGLSPSILFGEEGFQAFVSQELHPLMCRECCVKPQPGDPIYPAINELRGKYMLTTSDVEQLRVLGPGCDHCAGGPEPGFRKGRTACVSILLTSAILRDILLSNKSELRVKLAREYFYSTRKSKFTEPDMTGKTVVQHMLYKVLQGDIPFDYFLQTTGDISIHDVYVPGDPA